MLAELDHMQTIKIGRLSYSVESAGTDMDGLKKYALVGSRGARYVTMRNKKTPNLLFIMRSDNRPVWFVEKSGGLERVDVI